MEVIMRCYLTLLPVFLLSLFTSPLHATIIHVPGDSTTIQGGINGSVDGDTVLVADGTYMGDGNRDIDFGGRAIVVLSENGPEMTIIDCEGDSLDPHRGFYFQNGEDSTSVVQGFTITNGWADEGGGIRCYESSPKVNNCTFSGNTAISPTYSFGGGGMYNYHSSPMVTNCTFIDNSAPFYLNYGGGMYNKGGSSPTVINCTFIGNSVVYGGGMCNWESSPTLTNCTFSQNSASVRGGGMCNLSGSRPWVTNCTFSGNTAGSYGGGMQNLYDSSPTVTNCTFNQNSASLSGGGMNNSSSSPTVTNCTFSGNTAGSYGGGMRNWESSPTLTNCTFSQNSASGSGGGMNNSSSSPTVTNCILWGDLPDEIANYSGSAIVIYSNVQGGYTGEGNIDEDPVFLQPDTTMYTDYRLLWESPCIDTGHPDSLDVDGTRSDMGAHYFNQDDYMTLYLTPDTTEVAQGGQFGVTYTLINRWDQPEPFWGLTLAFLPSGTPFNLIGPDQFTLPANTTIQPHLNHNVPPAAPLGQYEYWSRIGLPPSTLYDEDRFSFKVVE
jgi:hypothetical protein